MRAGADVNRLPQLSPKSLETLELPDRLKVLTLSSWINARNDYTYRVNRTRCPKAG